MTTANTPGKDAVQLVGGQPHTLGGRYVPRYDPMERAFGLTRHEIAAFMRAIKDGSLVLAPIWVDLLPYGFLPVAEVAAIKRRMANGALSEAARAALARKLAHSVRVGGELERLFGPLPRKVRRALLESVRPGLRYIRYFPDVQRLYVEAEPSARAPLPPVLSESDIRRLLADAFAHDSSRSDCYQAAPCEPARLCLYHTEVVQVFKLQKTQLAEAYRRPRESAPQWNRHR